MKRVYITTALTCLIVLAAFIGVFRLLNINGGRDDLKIGFIYDNDESTPYTYNFSLSKDAVEKKYGDRVEILTCSNVLDEEMEEPLRELAEKGCDIIFFNGYSELVMALAPEYPDTQFCQTSYMDMSGLVVPDNYHSFKGEAYQGRYVSGIAAGMKIRQMIMEGLINEDEAVVGFVASFPTSEVISGYTAFLLGVRSVVPQAVMRVCYTGTWSSYAQEKSAALKLIGNGCVILICWEPYVLSAVDAVMKNRQIESRVSGRIHGSDVSAGFEKGWVEMTDLNLQAAAPGTQDAMDRAIDMFRRGNVDFVFRGNYKGVDPTDPLDTCNLQTGYVENEHCSYPLFHYILTDIITIEN